MQGKGLQVACGGDHTLAIDVAGALYAWGRGNWGQTGHGTNDNLASPRRVAELEGKKVVQVGIRKLQRVLVSGEPPLCLSAPG